MSVGVAGISETESRLFSRSSSSTGVLASKVVLAECSSPALDPTVGERFVVVSRIETAVTNTTATTTVAHPTIRPFVFAISLLPSSIYRNAFATQTVH